MPASQKQTSWSLRKTLLTTVLAITMTIWTCSGIVIYFEASNESQALFDKSLAETARLLLTLADHEVEERLALSIDGAVESNVTTSNEYILFQVWDNNRHLIYKNYGAPDQAFNPNNSTGFGWIRLNNQTWRTYTLWDNIGNHQIQVGEAISHRKEIDTRFAIKLLIFALLVLPVITGIIWWSVNRIFSSLQHYADEMATRTPNDLHPIAIVDAPIELRPLLNAINQLFIRVDKTIDQERRFTANASHELRTPLTAIKTNLQVIQRARNPEEQKEAVEGLIISVNRATHLLEQLLRLSRLDPGGEDDAKLKIIDLKSVVRRQTQEMFELAKNSQIHLDLQLHSAFCKVNAESMRIAVRNLYDNAVRYTPAGGRVLVSCGSNHDAVFFSVADNGPGIAPEMREKVFERFFRMSDSITSGSGLGLSIVKSIVTSQHATLELSDGLDGKGLCVTITFNKSEDATQA
jgi:signal transduction histidine kinase